MCFLACLPMDIMQMKNVQFAAFVPSAVKWDWNFALHLTRGVHTAQTLLEVVLCLSSLGCRRCVQAGPGLGNTSADG